MELTKLTAKFEKDLQTKAKSKEDQKVLLGPGLAKKDKRSAGVNVLGQHLLHVPTVLQIMHKSN